MGSLLVNLNQIQSVVGEYVTTLCLNIPWGISQLRCQKCVTVHRYYEVGDLSKVTSHSQGALPVSRHLVGDIVARL